MADDFPFDVFLSHSSRDKAIVRPLAERLRKDGLRVWFDKWELRPGDSIPSKIEAGLEDSRVLVLCMSAQAFGSDWAQLESGTFRFRDPLNKDRRFIPLRLDDAPIQGSLAQFLYINWHSANREQEYAKLLGACWLGAPPFANIEIISGTEKSRLIKYAATLFVALSALSWSIAALRNPPGKILLESTKTNLNVAHTDSSDEEADPPEDFPSIESSGLQPLTDQDRLNEDFSDTIVVVANETDRPIKLAYSYLPRPSPQQASHYAHRLTEVIESHRQVSQRESYFGGPVQISVLYERKWYPTNVWIDLRVVAKRTLTVSKDESGFRCDVQF